MSYPLVSIIIPTHNRRDMVIRLLQSIIASTYKSIEVIVVDDASVDGTAVAIKKAFFHNNAICVERNKINLFAAGSRNVGTKKSKGKYIFYIDDDNVLEKNAISRLVNAFEANEKIGELGLVNYSFIDRKKILWLFTKRNMLTSKTYLPDSLEEFSNQEVWDTVDVPNAFMVRADVIKQHKISFCNFFGIMYEESDLAYRIRKAGYTIQVVRDAKIYHDVKDYMPHFMNDEWRLYVFARNRIIFHSLYSSKLQLVSILLVWIWIFALYYSYKILAYSGAGSFSPAKRIHLVIQYFKGNIDGLLFVIRNEKLSYS
ncbi:MAG: hypothetical protein ACD_48C00081G0003 [uncultured bacterium]|nr:MAG: hypothetical protein ACD_48C00081G0003 [uncultured bacterium]